jgi:putative DNA methylase
LEAYASDLNPVAVLINKAMIEIPPKFAGMPPVNPEARSKRDLIERHWKGAEGLAEDVRYYGKWMRDEAEKRIGHLYPKVEVSTEIAEDRPDLKPYVGKKLTVIAWIWARTVKSPNPAFHMLISLSFPVSCSQQRVAGRRMLTLRSKVMDTSFKLGPGLHKTQQA